jgi:hypothetical protein
MQNNGLAGKAFTCTCRLCSSTLMAATVTFGPPKVFYLLNLQKRQITGSAHAWSIASSTSSCCSKIPSQEGRNDIEAAKEIPGGLNDKAVQCRSNET